MTANKQTQAKNAKQQRRICRFSEEPRHVIQECRKRICKEHEQQNENNTAETPTAKTNQRFPRHQRTNHTADMCWNGPYVAIRPKRYKTENVFDLTDESRTPGTSIQKAPSFFLESNSN